MAFKTNISSFIYSYIPFSDDRLQFIDIRGWDGQGINLNREFYINLVRDESLVNNYIDNEKKEEILREIKKRTEDVDGIYILLGEDVENLKDGIVYIGETGDFKKRMMQYFGGNPEGNKDILEDDLPRSKDFCSEIFFFSQREKMGGSGLGESLRKSIEAKIIQETKNTDRYRLINTNINYNQKLNLSDKDVMYDFYNRIKIIMEHLGIPLLKEKISVKDNDIKNYFICTERGANAIMYRGDIGYVVLKNSIVVKDYVDSFPKQYKKIFDRRNKLIDDGILIEQENEINYKLLKDQEFDSASGAADFVSGGHYSGNKVWKNKDNPNITLGEFLNN